MKSKAIQPMVEMVALATNKAHPMVVNPFTHLWHVINVCQLLSHTFSKYVKLVEDSHDSHSWIC